MATGDDADLFHRASCQDTGNASVEPTHGFIELSPLGEIQASLPLEPSFRSKASEVLFDYGLGTTSFQDVHQSNAFGTADCGGLTLS